MTTPPASTRPTDLRLFQTMAGARHGGAELFFERLAVAFHAAGMSQQLMIKPDSDRMARLRAAGLDVAGCGFSPLLAALHRRQLAAAIRRARPDVILSWMNRATILTPVAACPHVARLGGFYNLKYYRGCDWLVANTRDIADYLIAEGVPKARVHHQINFVPDGRDGPVFEGPRGAGPVIAALGRLQVNISGCINACGHHHAADIGILGVDKKGVEHYQITLGGRAGEAAAIGRIIGPSFAEDKVPAVIETIIDTYLAGRETDESFAAYLVRSGTDAVKQAVYGPAAPRGRVS